MNIHKTALLISELRREKGMTQKALAEKLHVSDRTISKWERAAGFPDVTLLEPLADELGVSVQVLLSGEKESGAEQNNDRAVREAIKFVYQQCREKTRKNLRVIICSVAMAVMFGYLAFAALDRMGVFLKEVSMELPAVIYEDGVEVGQTMVTVNGTLKVVGERSFFGEFRVPEAPTTGREAVNGTIRWDHPEEGYQEIFYSRPGVLGVDAGIQRYLYISPDMRHFALTLDDGKIIATNDALAKLEGLEGKRYALNYAIDGYPYWGYYIAGE